MEWQLILALVIAIPIVLVPVVLVWYLNIGGIYAAIKEGRFRALAAVVGAMRIALPAIVLVAIYALVIWFFLGNFGWQVALAVALVLPIVFCVPVLVWAAVASGLYQVIRDTRRRRVTAPRVRMAKEPVLRKVA